MGSTPRKLGAEIQAEHEEAYATEEQAKSQGHGATLSSTPREDQQHNASLHFTKADGEGREILYFQKILLVAAHLAGRGRRGRKLSRSDTPKWRNDRSASLGMPGMIWHLNKTL